MRDNAMLEEIYGEEIIWEYTRARAISEGFLFDASELAKEAGFNVPVAITESAYEKYVEWSDEDSVKQTYQDETGRLWDLLTMLAWACRRGSNESTTLFKFRAVPRDGRSQKASLATLKASIHGGDDGEPVMTIMMPDED